MKTIALAASIALLAVSVPAAAAFPDGNLQQCNRIVDVSVPYDVDDSTPELRFTDGSATIAVSSDRIKVGEQVFRDASVRGYYDDLRSFLGNAGSMANAAKNIFKRDGFANAASNMCQAILAVHASGEAMQQRFNGFTTPVRVVLK